MLVDTTDGGTVDVDVGDVVMLLIVDGIIDGTLVVLFTIVGEGLTALG